MDPFILMSVDTTAPEARLPTPHSQESAWEKLTLLFKENSWIPGNLDEHLRASQALYLESARKPFDSYAQIQEQLFLFLQSVSYENIAIDPKASRSANLAVASTQILEFLQRFSFSQILNRQHADFLLYDNLLIQLKTRIIPLVSGYRSMVFAVETLKMTGTETLEEAKHWLNEKLNVNMQGENNVRLLSLGYRLPPPHLGHELLGYVSKTSQKTVIKVLDPVDAFKKGTKRPNYTSFTISDFSDCKDLLMSLLPLQLPKSNEEAVQHLLNKKIATPENVSSVFHSAIYTKLKGRSESTHFELKPDCPLSYNEDSKTLGCSFSYLKPLLYTALEHTLEKHSYELTAENELDLKVIIEATYLCFKLDTFSQLHNLANEEEQILLKLALEEEINRFVTKFPQNSVSPLEQICAEFGFTETAQPVAAD